MTIEGIDRRLAWAIESRVRPRNLDKWAQNPWRLQGIYTMPESIRSVSIRKDLEGMPYLFSRRGRARTICRELNASWYAQYRVVRVLADIRNLESVKP